MSFNFYTLYFLTLMNSPPLCWIDLKNRKTSNLHWKYLTMVKGNERAKNIKLPYLVLCFAVGVIRDGEANFDLASIRDFGQELVLNSGEEKGICM